MTTPWDPEALWLKAKLFINNALEGDERRPWDERALWASLALELLAKSALARVSPLLIAVPTEEGKNLLVSTGLLQGEASFKSIPARSLFDRCGKAFKPFSAKISTRIADNRNEYLHGATATFAPIPENAWWPPFWAQAVILVHACDKDLSDLVAVGSLSVVEKALDQNARNILDRFEMLRSRSQQRLARFEAGEMRESEAEEWKRQRGFARDADYSESAACPACGSDDGLLEGDEVLNTALRHERVSESDYDAWVDLEIGADHFSCETCHLVLDSEELLVAAGLSDTLEAVGDPGDFWEPDYGND